MLVFKFSEIAVIFLAGLIGGQLATGLERLPGRETITRHANMFAGGVFLGAGLLHMFPDAQSAFATFTPGSEFPVVALLVGVGFLAILLLDKVLFGLRHDSAAQYAGGSPIYPYVLWVTLSVHSIITGVALGLEDHFVIASAILIAVLAHKTMASMALAISFRRANIDAARSRNLLLLFYCSTPLGLVVGSGGSSLVAGASENVVEGFFDALAAGTFLYIAVVNILSKELSSGSHRMSLFAAALTGLCGMALIAVWS